MKMMHIARVYTPADLWSPSKECIEEAEVSFPPTAAQFAPTLFTTPLDSDEAAVGDDEAKCDKSKGPPLDLRSALFACTEDAQDTAAAIALPIPAAAMVGGGGIGGTGKANDEAP